MKKKIKIFLGAYVNFPNAQNVNCDNIAKYLDKEKFEVHTMYTSKMPIDRQSYEKQDIHLHKLIHHRFIWYWSKYLTMKFGDYDIYYLPKCEPMDMTFAKRHKGEGKAFIGSVEGVVGEQIDGNDINTKRNFNVILDEYFSISQCIQQSIQKYWKKNTSVLYLGVNPIGDIPRTRKRIQTVVWIGSIIDRKRPKYLLECAKAFPQLQFVMIGDGDKQSEVKNIIQSENLLNVSCLGRISNDKVYDKLKKADLLLMTSDKEGLPKVIGEAMISGVPAIYIDECYKVDYVVSGENGYAVPNLEQMLEKIQYLLDNPEKYQRMSEQAYQTIQMYTWGNLIKDYERYFVEQFERVCKK